MNRRIRHELAKPRAELCTPRYRWPVAQHIGRWLNRVNKPY